MTAYLPFVIVTGLLVIVASVMTYRDMNGKDE